MQQENWKKKVTTDGWDYTKIFYSNLAETKIV